MTFFVFKGWVSRNTKLPFKNQSISSGFLINEQIRSVPTSGDFLDQGEGCVLHPEHVSSVIFYVLAMYCKNILLLVIHTVRIYCPYIFPSKIKLFIFQRHLWKVEDRPGDEPVVVPVQGCCNHPGGVYRQISWALQPGGIHRQITCWALQPGGTHHRIS